MANENTDTATDAAPPAPAEAAPAAPAEAATATEASQDAAEPAAAATEGEKAETKASDSPSFPSPEDFGWDDFDDDHEKLPEQVRGWWAKFDDRRKRALEEAEQKHQKEVRDLNQLLEAYEELVEGRADPRVEQFEEENGSLKAKVEELEKARDEAVRKAEEAAKSVEEFAKQQARSAVDAFKEQNPKLFSKENLERTNELVDDGWEMEVLPALFELDSEEFALAKKAKEDGVPQSWAVRVARQGGTGEAKRQKPPQQVHKPRPAAQLTTGAKSNPSRGSASKKSPKNNSSVSLDDFISATVDKHMR